MTAFWGWITDSAGRALLVFSVVAVIGVYAISGSAPPLGNALPFFDHHKHTPAVPPPSPSPTPSVSPTTASPSIGNGREAVTEAAHEFTEAFFSKDGSVLTWHRRIDAVSTPALADLNDDTPRTEVPATRVRSIRVTGLTPDYAELEVRLANNDTLFVAVVLDHGRWLVNEFAPLRP